MADIQNVEGLIRAVPMDYAPAHAGPRFRAESGTALAETPADDVQFSELGTLLSRMNQVPGVRVGKVAKIRAAIASGTYETPHKINTVVDRLLGEFLRE